ncbi:organomercurial lyase MerB [Candidatus Mycobacterium methanotrophicum]|uniref:Organomercurial lyase MerB n=1 Tax=Candidatus Mycobacterium methanotrophicum TaxID=2943498 RepID=A0ABY4QQ34_9MYCO|nr:organomercurial lyase MerB [Candidatus Mycobacterium methanotrophicum]UQX12739.1 organomercurial lyase MerB [Candidatus Mycobacterium methanotrophicum]
MTDYTTDLIDRLATPDQTDLDPALLIPLLRLLASGNPVELTTLATTAGRTIEETRAHLARLPDTEYDNEGRVVGQGVTLRPTQHRFTVDGAQLHTWCALDTLIFPPILDREAHIESASPCSGQPIRLTAGPRGVRDVEPATAVVSLVNPDDITEIRSSFCNQVHFFTSVDDARSWLQTTPGGQVMPVAEAFDLAAQLAAAFLAAGSPHEAPQAAASPHEAPQAAAHDSYRP